MKRELSDLCRRGGVALLLLVGASVNSPAIAHPQFALSTVNRYGKLVLQSPRQGRIFYTLMVGDAPAYTLRQQADRNGDGTLDGPEQQALAASLRARVTSGVHLYRGDTEVALAWEPAPFELESPVVVAKAFAYELSAAVPFASTPTDELRYDDRVELGPEGDLELRVEEGPGMHVLHAESGVTQPVAPPGGTAGSAVLFQWYGPPRSSLSDRSVRVRFAALTATRRPGRIIDQARRFWMLGALVLAVAVAGLLVRRRAVSPRPDR